MAKKCKDYLDIWQRWQVSPEEWYLPPDVSKSIEHIASCKNCLEEAAGITNGIISKTTDEERKIRLKTFIMAVREVGAEKASQQYPVIAAYLARNKYPFERFYAINKVISLDSVGEKLPNDVAYTISRGIQSFNWTTLYAKESGIDRHGNLAGQPKIAIEFNINTTRKEVTFNNRPVLSITLPSKIIQIQAGSSSNTQAERIRYASVSTENLSAQVLVDPQNRTVRVLLPDLPEYITRLPKIMILLENGTTIVQMAHRVTAGYESLFTLSESGNYLLAIDIIETAPIAGFTESQNGPILRIPDREGRLPEKGHKKTPPNGYLS